MRTLLWLCLFLPMLAIGNPQDIRYASQSGVSDPHRPYMLALLQLACQKMQQQCVFHAGESMNQSRAIVQLGQANSGVDLFWSMTDGEREARTLPIRIPLYKGLIGWRVALVNSGQKDRLADVHRLADLRKLRAGQVGDWPDSTILRQAGIEVIASSDYVNLFPMLRQQRYDFFPRSVVEVLTEWHSDLGKGLVIDPNVIIHYPTAFYFFVSPHKPAMARMLEQGLELAIADGSFERTFQQFNGEAIRTLKIGQRRVIELPNPLLPAGDALAAARTVVADAALSLTDAGQVKPPVSDTGGFVLSRRVMLLRPTLRAGAWSHFAWHQGQPPPLASHGFSGRSPGSPTGVLPE